MCRTSPCIRWGANSPTRPARRSHALQGVIQVFTDQGIVGEYLGGSESEHASISQFASWLIGRNALAREAFYNRAKHILKQTARMGLSQVDVALWDIAGKFYDAPVYELLGEYRKDLPCYASTTIGDDSPGRPGLSRGLRRFRGAMP